MIIEYIHRFTNRNVPLRELVGTWDINPKKGGGLELPGRVGGADSAPPCENGFSDCFCQFFLYHPSNVYTMKVHVAWEHSSFKNVELVAIQSFDSQAQIFNLSIFGKI